MTAVRSKADAAPGTLTGKHVLGIFGAFFLIVFATDFVLVWRAVSTFGGIDTPDAYRKGLAYNERLEAAERQTNRGWKETIAFDKSTGRLAVTIAGADGQGVDGLGVEAVVGRAATNANDRKLTLKPEGRGTYTADLSELAPGSWVLTLAAHAGAGQEVAYRAKSRLWRAP